MSSGQPGEGVEELEVRAIAAERLTFFADAVVAIAITLLALDLPLPEGKTNVALLHSLGDHRAEYISFLISFVVIGGHWRAHHRLFRYVTALGGQIIRISFVWLLMQVLMPFATKVLAEDGAFEFRFTFYALVQIVALGAFLLIVQQIRRHALYRPDMPPDQLTRVSRGIGAIAAGFAVSIPVALVTQWAYACWLVVPFLVNLSFRLAGRHLAE